MHQFWDDVLDYSNFSLTVDRADIPRLHTILADVVDRRQTRALAPSAPAAHARALLTPVSSRVCVSQVSEERRERLRAGMHAHHRLFLWERPYGLAYELSMLVLCRRAERLPRRRAALRCPHLQQLLRAPLPRPAFGPRVHRVAWSYFVHIGHSGLTHAAPSTSAGVASSVSQPAAAASFGAAAASASAAAATARPDATGRRCPSTCSAHEPLYAQIDTDLAAFPEGITKSMMDAALARWSENSITAALMIHNGSLYFLRPEGEDKHPVHHNDGMMHGTLNEIFSLLNDPAYPPLPDVEFILNADDYGHVSAHAVRLSRTVAASWLASRRAAVPLHAPPITSFFC